jgi:CRP/FNR family nitrogen fixation transcriptional regulator
VDIASGGVGPRSNIIAQPWGESIGVQPGRAVMQEQALEQDRRQIFRGILEHRSFDTSKALFPCCDQQTVRDSIFALRRGPVRYSRNATIACEGDPTDYMYVVVSGVVRSCRTHRDGSRGIVAFHLPGELFGWSGEPVHSLSLEAATDTLVFFLKRSALLAAAIRDDRIATYLLAATTNELRRVQDHSLLLSRRAECRVATFLIDLSMRLGTMSSLDLPMSHQDIADHLGLTIETLSRTITTLEKSGSIVRSSCRILVLRNRASLEKISD